MPKCAQEGWRSGDEGGIKSSKDTGERFGHTFFGFIIGGSFHAAKVSVVRESVVEGGGGTFDNGVVATGLMPEATPRGAPRG